MILEIFNEIKKAKNENLNIISTYDIDNGTMLLLTEMGYNVQEIREDTIYYEISWK